MTRCQRDCHTPTAVPAPAGIDYASLTLISFPDGLISTGDRAFEGAAPLLAPIPKGILIIRISDVEQRHASFLSNAQSLLQGSGIDAPLDVGRACQASALARSLASIQMDLIASSTLSRAVETADIVASQLLIVQFSLETIMYHGSVFLFLFAKVVY